MKKITICFDIDGTLISSAKGATPVANERIRTLLVTLASFKNVEVIVWSGGGELYCRQVCTALGLTKYISGYYSKNHMGFEEGGKHIFKPDIVPDIAIDDIHYCELGKINLIVREK